MQPPHLHCKVRAVTSEALQTVRCFRTSFCSANSSALLLPRTVGSIYAVSVRRLGTLPPASADFSPTDLLHNRHPCLWLTLPAAICAADFHRQVTAHAGRTETPRGKPRGICRSYIDSNKSSWLSSSIFLYPSIFRPWFFTYSVIIFSVPCSPTVPT